jgi:hypothetical protein
MRYVDELLRNAVAEIRLWAQRRAARRLGQRPRAAGAGSPLVAGLTRPIATRDVRQREQSPSIAAD